MQPDLGSVLRSVVPPVAGRVGSVGGQGIAMSSTDAQGAAGPRPAGEHRRGRPGLVEVAFLLGLVAFVLVAAGLTIEVGFQGAGSHVADPDALVSTLEGPSAGDESAAHGALPGPTFPVEPVPEAVSVQILDGGAGAERIAEIRAVLQGEGFRVVATNAAREMDSIVLFTTGFEQEAVRVAERLGVADVRPMDSLPPERRLSSSVMVHVVIGRG